MALDKTSPLTAISITLGTGQACMDKPPNLSLISDEHLHGLREAVNKEHIVRVKERQLFKPPGECMRTEEKITKCTHH